MKVLTVVGNRPQFIKAAAVSNKLRQVATEVLVHTGQHYDADMSDVFFKELSVPTPDHHLEIAGGSNVSQIARMLSELEQVVITERPDAVLVYGDTNSTLAGALVATDQKVPLFHVEAGMRSFDRSMPEETNRVVVDHLASRLLCSSGQAVRNLEREHVVGEIELTGDVMVDLSLQLLPEAKANSAVLDRYSIDPDTDKYCLVTLHRAANVDDPVRLKEIVERLVGLERKLIFPLHPRTRERLNEFGLLGVLDSSSHLILTPPLGYRDLMSLVVHAERVITDSGGLQKEAYVAKVPCVTLRTTTEWTETIDAGWNALCEPHQLAKALTNARPVAHPPLYGDGNAATSVVDAIVRNL